MKLLLDTHAILWWVRDDRRLGREARRAIANADVVWVSAASGWEMAIKIAKGRLRVVEPLRGHANRGWRERCRGRRLLS